MDGYFHPADAEPLPPLRARLTRRGGARGLGAPRRRKLATRRTALLAALAAVPVLAAQQPPAPAPAGMVLHADEVIAAGPVRAGGRAGDARPGLLAQLPSFADMLLGRASAPDFAGTGLLDPGPAARPLVVQGSDRDHARAQRCMTQAIYYEAASESAAGQRAVAQVVLNRVAHPAWPDTVCGVVYQGSERQTGCQFTFTCDGSLARVPSADGWARASRIAREALAGVVYAPVGLATHYHTLAVNPYWAASLENIATIGAHTFYRWRGVAGAPLAFRERYRGDEPQPGHDDSGMAAPDPLAPPALPGLAGLPGTANLPGVPAVAPAQPAAPANAPPSMLPPAPAGDALPAAGTVRSEYANSGAWLRQP